MTDLFKFYLENTDYKVTVVHPIAAVKYMSWIDTEDGSVKSRRKSPKKESLIDVLPELYWLSDMLSDSRLDFCFPFLEMEEYRLLDGWSRDKKRGSNRFERIPTDILDIVRLEGNGIEELLPHDMPDEFTRTQISSLLKLKGRKLYNALALLCAVGAVEKGEKKGRSYAYRRSKPKK